MLFGTTIAPQTAGRIRTLDLCSTGPSRSLDDYRRDYVESEASHEGTHIDDR